MEPWLLVFTVVHMAVSSPVVVLVNKLSHREHIPEGSSVTLQCCVWNSVPERLRMSWHFNPHEGSKNGSENLFKEIINVLPNTSEITAASCLKNKTSNRILATHNISNFSRSHSGWYSCDYQAEIPFHPLVWSNWTQLVVENSVMERTTSPSQTQIILQAPENVPVSWDDWWLWIAVGVAGLILMILLIMCIVLRRRQLRNRVREDPVYANMRQVNSSRQPSPRPAPPDLKIDPYQNLNQTPNPGQRYERGRRLQR